MSYNITKSNGDILVQIQPGDIDEDSTSLRLLGQGVVNYGELVAENFVQLTENFAGPNLPPNPITGQLWYDSVVDELKVIRKSPSNVVSARSLISTADEYVTSSTIPAETVSSTFGDLRYFSAIKTLAASDGNNWIPVSSVYRGSDNTETNYPIGTILVVQGTFERNINLNVGYDTGNLNEFVGSLSPITTGTLVGTWRARGALGINYTLVQRTG